MSNRNRILIALLLAAAALLTACDLPALPGKPAQLKQLDSNVAKWDSQGITHYKMKVAISCFCPFYGRMPVAVEVQDGTLVSAIDAQGQPVAENDPLRLPENVSLLTVEDIFARARAAIQKADEVTLTYDETLGYPLSMHIDWIRNAVDDEEGVTISELQVLP